MGKRNNERLTAEHFISTLVEHQHESGQYFRFYQKGRSG
jgi:hypothetical protein